MNGLQKPNILKLTQTLQNLRLSFSQNVVSSDETETDLEKDEYWNLFVFPKVRILFRVMCGIQALTVWVAMATARKGAWSQVHSERRSGL